jgi:hypothetical protein
VRGFPQGGWVSTDSAERAVPAASGTDAFGVLDDLIRCQHGVVTRVQAIAGGLTGSQIEVRLSTGRWRRIFTGVYLTFNGPVPRRSLLWAVVLRAGSDAVLSHETAAELAGLGEPTPVIHVTVPSHRTPGRIAGVVIHRSVHLTQCRHPTRLPPQTRVEDTVVDLTQSCRRLDDAMAWLARAVGSRTTTPERLAARFQARPKLRDRQSLLSALSDVASGCHSLVELRYLRDVERAHGLPPSQRQVRREKESRYDDVRYREFRTRVELDGRAAHPEHERWRDMRRDNAAVVEGDQVLRYGSGDVEGSPCELARQVAAVLTPAGWPGQLHPCSRPGCVIP